MTRSLSQIIFPHSCVLCGRLGAHLCVECSKLLVVIGPQRCTVCGKPFDTSPVGHPCSDCLSHKPHYDQHQSIFVFNEHSQQLIHSLKYHAQFWVRRFLEPYFKNIQSSFQNVDLIIPVPLYTKRLQKRGFNQSLLLAQIWKKLLSRPVSTQALLRVKDTPTQTGLHREERQKNLRDAFCVPSVDLVAEKTILLIDDVHTTGVTLNVAAKALKFAGAKKVLASTVVFVK